MFLAMLTLVGIAGIEGMTMTQTLVEEGGQVVLIRKLRERYGIGPGTLVEEIRTEEGILIKPIQNQFDRWSELKKKISERWYNISAVQAVWEDRGGEWN
jgi:bifunctional DNA-binding transcriptional regulator/antitoxin component of YhaV-PrlF toxin-antitoxin module